jgi:AcrR family transcriptional regulator
MPSNDSKLAAFRQNGATQVDLQRTNILGAAEYLFLHKGLEQTTMSDIVEQARITRVTLYRYFANRDEVALAIYPRMLAKLAALLDATDTPLAVEDANKLARAMIRNFSALREVYRFFGVFDALYLDHRPDTDVNQWARAQLDDAPWLQSNWTTDPAAQRAIVLLSSVIWFLEKVALRDDGTGSVQGIPVAEQLHILEEIVTVYVAHLLAQR